MSPDPKCHQKKELFAGPKGCYFRIKQQSHLGLAVKGCNVAFHSQQKFISDRWAAWHSTLSTICIISEAPNIDGER